MIKKSISYFCIAALTIFQLSLVANSTPCCCVDNSQFDTVAVSDQNASTCCAVVEISASDDIQSNEPANEPIILNHNQTTFNLCACEHRSNPDSVDELVHIIVSKNDTKEQIISVQLHTDLKLNETKDIKNPAFHHQVYNPLIITNLKTVILRM